MSGFASARQEATSRLRVAAETDPQEPVTVVGAGPSGLAAAITLAQAGRRVHVREWHETVGHRFHDDFQGLENWSRDGDAMDDLAALGARGRFFHKAVFRGTVFDTQGRAHQVRSERPLFHLLRRGPGEGTLDRGLLEAARAAGVEITFNDRVREVDGAAIIATGPRRADVIAVGYTFRTAHPDGAWLALGEKLAPGGYAYLLIAGGRGTLASCMFRNFHDQSARLEATRAFFTRQLGLRMDEPRQFGGYGNFHMPRSAVQGGKLVVGERAGFQDAFAGFGIRTALRSGILAARAIVENHSFDALWYQEIAPTQLRGLLNRAMFDRTGGALLDRMVRRAARGDAGRAVGRAYRPNALSRLAAPLIARAWREPANQRDCNEPGCGCVLCKCAAWRKEPQTC